MLPSPAPARFALAGLALATLLMLVHVPAASARRALQTVYAGPVSATLSYDDPAAADGDRGLHVRIRRRNRIVAGRDLGDARTRLAGGLARGKSIALANLDGDAALEIVVATSRNRVVSTDVFDYAGENRYRRVRRDWNTAGLRLRDVDARGRLEFVTVDTRVAAELAAPGFRGGPIRIFQFRGAGFAPVTAAFAAAVRRNAAFWLGELEGAGGVAGRRGALAAYAADRTLLGEGAEGLAFVREHPDGGEEYADALASLLARLGYPVSPPTSAP